MIGFCQLLLTLGVVLYLPAVVGGCREWGAGLPRRLFGAGLVFFILTWLDFACYVFFGWGVAYDLATWAVRLGALAWCIKKTDFRPFTEAAALERWVRGFLLKPSGP